MIPSGGDFASTLSGFVETVINNLASLAGAVGILS
jgi:hypothetical protein